MTGTTSSKSAITAQTNESLPKSPSDFASLTLESARISNFRGLDECYLTFERDLTVLVGRNNAGKSRVLRAIGIALGAVAAEKDDLTVNGTTNATIDVMFAPMDTTAEDGEIFDERSGSRLGTIIQNLSEEPPKERFAWRTTVRPSQEGLGVQSDSSLLIFNQTTQEWALQEHPTPLTAKQRSIVAADLVQTRRDLVDELTRRGSPIRRVLDDLEVSDDVRTELEGRLDGLGKDILRSSKSLAAVATALAALTKAVDEIGHPRFEPLPVRLEELVVCLIDR